MLPSSEQSALAPARKSKESRSDCPMAGGAMGESVRTFDWSLTPLGPMGKWAEGLTVLVDLMLTSPLVSSLVCGGGRTLIYNDAAAARLGERRNGALGRPVGEVFPTMVPYYDRAFTGEPVCVREYPQDPRSGSPADIFDAYLTPVRDQSGEVAYVHMTGFEIGDHVRAEAHLAESEQRFRLFVQNVREYALVQTDLAGAVVSWNSGAERFFGYTSAEVLGRNFSCLLTEEDRVSGVREREYAAVTTGGRSEESRWLQRKDGTRFWGHWFSEPLRDEGGELRGIAKVLRDETERQEAQRTIERSLGEMEARLGEFHHRVENDFQVITSLLNLQARHIRDPAILGLFEETGNRVQSIALIYELLHRSKRSATMDLPSYARQLAADLVRSHGSGTLLEAEVVSEGQGLRLEMERGVPYALLLNELISSACKRAFAPEQSGKIKITFRRISSDIELEVADDGGADEVSLPETNSLGVQLIRGLIRQLRGAMEVVPGSGRIVRVRFPGAEGSI